MREDRFNELNGIISDNLKLLNKEVSSAVERRFAQLYERAALIAQDGALLESDERCDEFRAMFNVEQIPAKASEAAKRYLAAYYDTQLLSDKLAVCKFLAERIDWNIDSILNKDVEPDEHDVNGSDADKPSVKIAYLKNVYADMAFRRFSEVLESPSVDYVSDFAAVCEEVYYGRADMCILPLDSSRDAKLISFCRLIDKYELKIILSCDVVSPDGGVTTRYALLQKSAALPNRRMIEKCNSIFFEFNFVPDQTSSLSEVLTAAEGCGLKLYKIDAIPLTYSDSEFSYDVIFSCGDGNVDAFALYMMLSVPQYDMLGIYPHMESEA
ncbi:MAG: hypothetical protein HFE63_09980 [Clostridiales bacterium]|nr:hypothetical protein [Clostridiales bacterium]